MDKRRDGYKFKIGDKVKLRSDLVTRRRYGEYMEYNDRMYEVFKPGSVVTIKSFNVIYKDCYGVEGFFGNYWSAEMFEGLVEETPTPAPALDTDWNWEDLF